MKIINILKNNFFLSFVFTNIFMTAILAQSSSSEEVRNRISLNDNWKFFKYSDEEEADDLIYDLRPEVIDDEDGKAADAKPTEAEEITREEDVLKPWIMPTGNKFISNPSKEFKRPEGNPGQDFPFVQSDFDDSEWEDVELPHDWAIEGPFMEGWEAEVGGGMGRLPSPGVAWYRRKINIAEVDQDKQVYLDIDGAMSYAMVWINGKLAGGWPYGYNSFRVDLTPYLEKGENNQLAIRLDNPPASSRWYPGGGLYRNVWLTKTEPLHVEQWGAFVTTPEVTEEKAEVNLEIDLKNNAGEGFKNITVKTEFFLLDKNGQLGAKRVAQSEDAGINISSGKNHKVNQNVIIENPKLWGPPPTQEPNMYIAVTKILNSGELIDEYETEFGIRSLEIDAEKGVIVNNEPIFIKGVNQHHDLGALGAAFNYRAAERQLEILKEMGVNAIRIAHNPPAPELLDLTDRMGFLVVNEIFDVWERKKTPLDFHLIFPDWHEQDLRSFIRRDRNNPSVIMWSYGNEVGEQYTEEEGAALSEELQKIVKEEDSTRPTTVSMNYAKPDMPFARVADVINLNYQGEGIRNTPAHADLDGIRTDPLYDAFHNAFPNKLILSSENAAALSTRGAYTFPVQKGISYPVNDSMGGNSKKRIVSDYGLYAVEFGSSPDKVFKAKDDHPYVGGGFVWSGWDYLGEPSPYYLSRSSYFGIVDLAGFKKNRFYLYQSRWRPDLKMAHILPHWNWPDRVGEVTPVHVFSSGDEAELFLNGESQGRIIKKEGEYRFRWDEIVYKPGKLEVITYKNGKQWATDSIVTTGEPSKLVLTADRDTITADGDDLSFVTVEVVDEEGRIVPNADNRIYFEVSGPGEMVATDNGNPADMEAFPNKNRKALSGKALVIIKPYEELVSGGSITLKAISHSLKSGEVTLKVE